MRLGFGLNVCFLYLAVQCLVPLRRVAALLLAPCNALLPGDDRTLSLLLLFPGCLTYLSFKAAKAN
jgi:hypothetical protein